MIKLIVIGCVMLVAGCATAEQRMASKAGYRAAQVEAIAVQKKAEVDAAQMLSAERVAMWQALSEAVKANPESASNLAIVAAVASTNGTRDVSSARITTLKTEQETTPLQYIQAMAPALVGGLTQVGIAALNTDYQKTAIRENSKVRIVEAEQDGKVWDAIIEGFGEAGDSNQINIIGGDFEDEAEQAADSLVEDEFPVDDELTDGAVGVDDPTDDVTDDPTDDVTDDPTDGSPDDVDDGEDDTDDPVTPEEVDCNEPQFSPAPEECLL